MEKKYHLGQEIKKEFEHQLGTKFHTIVAFANEINITRQQVYNIFKSESLNTQQLMKISQVLQRNFLKELSEFCMNGEVINEEEESVIMERISMLMPEDKLQVVKTSQVADVAEEYFLTPRKKPLLMFYDNGMNKAWDKFTQTSESILGADMIKKIDKKELVEYTVHDLAALPYKAIGLWVSDGGADKIIPFAENLIAESGKFVFIYYRVNYNIDTKYDDNSENGVNYNRSINEIFEPWHERIHIFVADNEQNNYVNNQCLYGSNKLCKEIPELERRITLPVDDEVEAPITFEQLQESLPEKHTFDIKFEDIDDNLKRCTFTEKGVIPNYRDWFKESGVNLYKEMTFEISKDSNAITWAECKTY